MQQSLIRERARLGDGPLTKPQERVIREREEVEHKQELACMGHLDDPTTDNQKQLDAPVDSVNPGNRRKVIADVLESLKHEEQARLRLRPNEVVIGRPWEVKDCDGMNPMEHAHGQSDFQRIFANCKQGSLWLFTEDLPSSNGRQNFAVLCEHVMPYDKDRYGEYRYDQVILAQRLEPYDCEDVSKEQAGAAIIATWRNGKIEPTDWNSKPTAAVPAAAPAAAGVASPPSPPMPALPARWDLDVVSDGHAALPKGMTHLPEEAFHKRTALVSVTCPSSLISIGEQAFAGCTSLVSINLPASLKTIGQRAFYDCSELTSIDLPAGLNSIGSRAFHGCESLKGVTVPASIDIGDFAFPTTTSVETLTVVL